MDSLTEEQKAFAIDSTIVLVVDELVKLTGADPTETLRNFVTSQTAGILYDESSKLWWCGPAYIADMYQKECSRSADKQPVNHPQGRQTAAEIMDRNASGFPRGSCCSGGA